VLFTGSPGREEPLDEKPMAGVDSVVVDRPQVTELLHQKARDRATTLRWNANILILVSINFITVVILTLQGANSVIVAPVAVFGLLLVWVVSWLQAQRMEKRFFRQEMQSYTELASSEQHNNGETAAASRVAEIPLTQREREILEQMAMGKVNKEIASSLGISAMTVKNHISHILEKLEVNDRTSAVLLAIRRRWINLDET